MKYKYVQIAAILLTTALSASGQQITDSKTLKKSFRVGDSPILEVSNKYGNVHVSSSAADSVSIRVEIEATSHSESKLRSIMSGVDVSIAMVNDRIIAETDFGNGINVLFESFKSATKSFINYDTRLQINYFIECPPDVRLRVNNSYGDVYIGDRIAELTLTLANGAFDADVIDSAPEIDLTFCKAEIKNVKKGKIKLSYGELRCENADDIALVLIASKTKIGNAGRIELDSKRDDIAISEAEIIRGSCYFSDITVETLKKEAGLVSKYGNLAVNSLNSSFSLVDINTSYTDIDINVEEKASYDFEIRHTNAFVSLPGITPEPERVTVSTEEKTYITTGKFGSSPASARIRIEANRGEIRIIQK